jgi:hypothetical protein
VACSQSATFNHRQVDAFQSNTALISVARSERPQGGRIQMLDGLSAAEEFVGLAHEYAHQRLHRADDRPASRDTRELEAEAVAFVVGEAVGLNVGEARHDSRMPDRTMRAVTESCPT